MYKVYSINVAYHSYPRQTLVHLAGIKVEEKSLIKALNLSKKIWPGRSIFAFPIGNTKSSLMTSSDTSKLIPYISSFSKTTTKEQDKEWQRWYFF